MRTRPSVIALAVAIAGRPAAANPIVQADGSVNVGYNQITQSTFEADPMAEPEDQAETTSTRVFTEIRPGISIQSGRPRLAYRAGYQFSGNFAFDGNPAYSNQADLALISLPTKYTTLTLSSLFAQGGTAFLSSLRPADAGEPEIRASGNPNIVSASLTETLSWSAGRHVSVAQSLSGSLSAPQSELGQYNGSLNGSLVLDRVFKRYSAGMEVRSSLSRLRPLRSDLGAYLSVTNGLRVRFAHDFSYEWSGLATAGIEQVFTDTGSEPLAILPSASVAGLYTAGKLAVSIDLSHGSFTNIQVGTVSVTDRIAARGVYTFDPQKVRSLSFSTGFLHNEPIGESEALVAAGTGNAVQADVGFTTAINKRILANARYSLAYQFGQDGGLEPILAHVFFVGVTASYSNSSETVRPLPSRGKRVDGSDAKGYPMGGDPIPGDDEPMR